MEMDRGPVGGMDVGELAQRVRELEEALRASEEAAVRGNREMEEALAEANRGLGAQAPVEVIVAPHEGGHRFRRRPTTVGEVTAEEWAGEMRAELRSRTHLSELRRAELVLRRLGGPAHAEVMARGEGVSGDAEAIIDTILDVFGEDASLPKLREAFYVLHQGRGEDLVSFSLRLVGLYDQMAKHDPRVNDDRQMALRERLAGSVADEGLRRELGRLNRECPGLSFFEFRKRGLAWLSVGQDRRLDSGSGQRKVAVESSQVDDLRLVLEEVRKSQREILDRQKALEERQSKTEAAISQAGNGRVPQGEWRSARGRSQGARYQPERDGQGQLICYGCRRSGHIRRDCPQGN